MALTAQEIEDAARKLGNLIFFKSTAHSNLDELKAVIQAIDNVMIALPPALAQGQSVEVNINNALPAAFKASATLQQKSLAISIWAEARAG